MFTTNNGRPARLGSMYFERAGKDRTIRKYCVGYIEGKKIGLTAEDLREFASNMPSFFPEFLHRLFRAKILIP